MPLFLNFIENVNGNERNKKVAAQKEMMQHNDGQEDGIHSHHPDVGRNDIVPNARGDHKLPADRLPANNRHRDHSGSSGHSSSSSKHSDKSSHRARKHKNKKHRKHKHNKHQHVKKHQISGKRRHL